MTVRHFLQTEIWAQSECSNIQESKKLIDFLKNTSLPASLSLSLSISLSLSLSLSLFEIVKVF